MAGGQASGGHASLIRRLTGLEERKALASRLSLALGLSGIALLAAAVIDSSDGPRVSAQEADKVTICHRSDSVANPYQVISVDADSVDGDSGNDQGQGDHAMEHQGPVATSEEVAQELKDAKTEWGDIIPPHDNFAGLNWTAEGQAIYENDCSYSEGPEPTTEPTQQATTSPTEVATQEATSVAAEATPAAEVAGVVATQGPEAVVAAALPSTGTGGYRDTGARNELVIAGLGLMLSGLGVATLARKSTRRG